MKLIKRHYEEGYHENPLYRESRRSQRNDARLAVLRQAIPGGRLLEIGCGQGGFLRAARPFYEVECMDISSEAVKAIQAEFGDSAMQGNIAEAMLPSGHYQAIAAFNILEHLRQPVLVIQKLFNALSAGGVVIGSVPNNSGPVGTMVTRIGNFFDRTHVSTPPPAAWRAMFVQAGFAAVDFFGEVTIGRNRCVYVRAPWWQAVSFNLMFVCRKQIG